MRLGDWSYIFIHHILKPEVLPDPISSARYVLSQAADQHVHQRDGCLVGGWHRKDQQVKRSSTKTGVCYKWKDSKDSIVKNAEIYAISGKTHEF